ncbi:MAG: uracil-DNA glycosylase [Alphaproteobacteria bacterium]|nr:MAG: uracil-DNA glycosylase [Alphaproteobacteria bacterium]
MSKKTFWLSQLNNIYYPNYFSNNMRKTNNEKSSLTNDKNASVSSKKIVSTIDEQFTHSSKSETLSDCPVFEKASTLRDLRSNMSKVNFPFKKQANTMVFADGNENSSLMLIGEAPGKDEDQQGKPFVGESGKLLEEMLNAAGIFRKNYYITNVVPWRPPSNRTPTVEEINIMRPYIINHIEIIHPKIVVLIGSVAYRAVMNSMKAITTVRGEFINIDGILYLPIFHPSYLLRSPSKKKEMWSDILALKHKLREIDPIYDH